MRSEFVQIPNLPTVARREFLVLAAGAAVGGCRLLSDEDDAALARARAEALDQLAKGYFTGAAFARSDRGEAGFVGWQGRGRETGAVDARTKFDAASLTKTVVAAVASLMVADGRLDPDAPFVRYLPDHAAGGNCPITVRQVATHTSGFGHAVASARRDNPTLNLATRPFEERLLAQKPERAPGRCKYSCYNFQLLALLLERLGGKPIDVLAREMLFEPLGMNDSRWWPIADDGHVMHADALPKENFIVRKVGCVSDPSAYHAGRPTGNAGLFTTLGDLRRFTADLLHRERFPRQYYELLFTCQHEDAESRRSFGFDMSEAGHPAGLSPRTIHHSGYTGQYLCVDPETDFAGVVLTVRSADVGTLAGRRRILACLAGTAIDADAAGVVSYLRSFGTGETLNRGDDSPRTDSGRQVSSCEQHSSDFASRSVLTHGAYDDRFHARMTNQFALLQSDR